MTVTHSTDPRRDNERFRAEVERLDFRFRCEDCDHYAPVAGDCSLGFEPFWLTTPDIRMVTDDGRLVFCKYFEPL